MNRKYAFLTCALVALVSAMGGTARADYFYNFSPIDFPTVLSDHSGMGINLVNQPQVGPITTGQNTNVVATTMTTFINPGITGTDTFTTGQHSTIALTIIDGTQNATVNFGLKFSGSLSATSSQISIGFDGPTTQTLTVNGQQYSVTLNSIVAPGIPGAIPGSVGGQVLAGIQISGGGGDGGGTGTGGGGTGGGGDGGGTGTGGGGDGGGTNNAPEPSTMILSVLGAAFFGAGSLRRWRQAKKAAA
jgi:hypothetical protein